MNRYIVLSGILMAGILVLGCTEDSGVSAPGRISCPDCCDDTAIAIGIALNDPAVRAMLGDSYSIAGVNHNATVTLPLNGIYTTINTIDVMVDTPGNRVHVYVDTQNCTVISIWPQPKRLPVRINPGSHHDQPCRRLCGRGRVYGQMALPPFLLRSLLFIEITPVDFKPAPWEEHPGPRTTISGMIQMVEYHDGISRWYYDVNTTSLLPNRYEIWVWSNPDDPYWEGVSTEFTLSGGNQE